MLFLAFSVRRPRLSVFRPAPPVLKLGSLNILEKRESILTFCCAAGKRMKRGSLCSLEKRASETVMSSLPRPYGRV